MHELTKTWPQSFDDFIGQETVKQNLAERIETSKIQNKRLDPILLMGRPGCGKTCLAVMIARELNGERWMERYVEVIGSRLRRDCDLRFIKDIAPESVVFMDEIDGISKSAEKSLCRLLDEPTRRADNGNLRTFEFTLIGATTNARLLSRALYHAFKNRLRLTQYSIDEVARIVRRAARLLNINIASAEVQRIARSSRGIPRAAIAMLRKSHGLAGWSRC